MNNEKDNIDTGLIDPHLLQRLQDYFCTANGVYLTCVGKMEGVITQTYGDKEKREFIYNTIGKEVYMSLLHKMEEPSLESIIEEELECDYLKFCGVSACLGENDRIIWLVVAVLEEKLPEETEFPEGILTTTSERFYHSLELLEVITRQLMAARTSEIIAQEAMLKSEMAAKEIEEQLKRSESTTEVVKLLESDNAFSGVVDEALERACNTLGISGGFLVRSNSDETTADIICQYHSNEDSVIFEKTKNIPLSELSFFNGRPYMISADSLRPEKYRQMLEKNNISAVMLQPVEVNNKLLMYIGFYDIGTDRIWSQADIEFLNDVKRIVQSVLAKRIAKNSLASSYASLEAILENVGCGIYVVDPQRKEILYMNNTFRKIYKNTDEAGLLEIMIFSERELSKAHCFEETYSDVEDKWFDVKKMPISWVDGREVTLCTVYDITDKKKYQRKIETQANNDFLTGLYNRMRCEQDLGRFIQKSEMDGSVGALIYIDLDDFKHINDGLGHQYGDILLKAISHSLLRIPGVDNNCYRMGGDEFIVIVKEATDEKVLDICTKIKEIFTSPWFLKGEDYYCTTSIGIAEFPSDGTSVDDIIRKADIALFQAKRKGKNCVIYYKDIGDGSASKRLDLEKNMRNATLNGIDEFQVYYQPIMDISGKEPKCCGAEALVRWKSDALGFIQPGDFIPLAEYLGLINPIGEYVLMNAAKRCRYWNEMGCPSYKVNVNLSVVQLLQNDIVKKIKNVLEETRINPKNLTLEVTESLAINDMERMKKILCEIKSLGVRVALDDFGTGYSSLNHIREMPIDLIKIDRCFIEHLAEDDFSDAFVKMVSQLANAIGVKVCVEGVESEAQYDIIEEMNIELVQGYYFGKPMKVEDFEKAFL